MTDPLSAEIAEAMLNLKNPTYDDALRLTIKRYPVTSHQSRVRIATSAVILYYNTYQLTKQAFYGKL